MERHHEKSIANIHFFGFLLQLLTDYLNKNRYQMLLYSLYFLGIFMVFFEDGIILNLINLDDPVENFAGNQLFDEYFLIL
jgi:hypothetical protein